ncbi:MAG: hypothetical protein AMS25_18350, partial [Gemmatimonas sp. SM23_52]
RLLARHASTVETDFRERVEAEQALREAIALDPYNPAYLAELGMLLIKQQMRIDGERVLNRALEMAEDRRLDLDPAVLADIHFNLGWAHEVRYEGQRHRRLTPLYREAIPATLPWSDRLNRYVEAYLQDARPIENAGQATRDVMLEHYWTALRNDPTHFDASRRPSCTWGSGYTWPVAKMRRPPPSSGRSPGCPSASGRRCSASSRCCAASGPRTIS